MEGVGGWGLAVPGGLLSQGRPPPQALGRPSQPPCAPLLAGLGAPGPAPRPEMPTAPTAPPFPAAPLPPTPAGLQARDPRARVAAAAGWRGPSAGAVRGSR